MFRGSGSGQYTEYPVYISRYHWADQLSEKIRDSNWLYSVVRPVVQGQYNENQYNRDMNLLFIKLHLLDPTAVFPAFSHLRKGRGIKLH